MLQQKLNLLEAKYGKRETPVLKHLPVYYGWAKLNRIQKREALTVIFLNDTTGPRIGKDGYDGVTRFIEPVYKRWQTEKEVLDAQLCNRVYTVYSIFMDDKKIGGSLEAALRQNSLADERNVSIAERKTISDKLRVSFMGKHRDYKEPVRQLFLFDDI